MERNGTILKFICNPEISLELFASHVKSSELYSNSTKVFNILLNLQNIYLIGQLIFVLFPKRILFVSIVDR